MVLVWLMFLNFLLLLFLGWKCGGTGCSCCARWVCVSSPSSTTTRPFTTSPCCVSSPPRTPTSNPSSWSQASSGGKRVCLPPLSAPHPQKRLLHYLSSVSQTAKLESWQMLREGEEEGQEEGWIWGLGGSWSEALESLATQGCRSGWGRSRHPLTLGRNQKRTSGETHRTRWV